MARSSAAALVSLIGSSLVERSALQLLGYRRARAVKAGGARGSASTCAVHLQVGHVARAEPSRTQRRVDDLLLRGPVGRRQRAGSAVLVDSRGRQQGQAAPLSRGLGACTHGTARQRVTIAALLGAAAVGGASRVRSAGQPGDLPSASLPSRVMSWSEGPARASISAPTPSART